MIHKFWMIIQNYDLEESKLSQGYLEICKSRTNHLSVIITHLTLEIYFRERFILSIGFDSKSLNQKFGFQVNQSSQNFCS